MGSVAVDTRSLGAKSYEAFVNGAIENNQTPLPDSNGLEVYTFTWLPVEKADSDNAQIGNVDDGRPNVGWFWRDYDLRRARFRSAVELQ